MAYLINADDVLSASNGGLEIFKEIFNIRDPKRHFQIRKEDDTFSASLHEKNGIWFVKDFGDVNGFYAKWKDGINAFAHERALSYFEALRVLAQKFGVIEADKPERFDLMRKCKLFQFEGKLNSDDYEIVTKDLTKTELEILGPLVTPELCKKIGLHSVKEYSWIAAPKEDEEAFKQKELRTVHTKISDESYPIFALIEPEHKLTISKNGKSQTIVIRQFDKIMQPKDMGKYRFRYFGHKGADHVFGLDYVKALPKPMVDVPVKDEEGNQRKDADGNLMWEKVQKDKHPRLFICSGERDSINMASLGVPVVWFNSETANINENMIKSLYKEAEEIINVPDIDPTGIEVARKLALTFIDLRTVWLPEELTKKTSWKGKPLKDFTDYVKELYNPDDEDNREFYRKFNTLVDNARPAKFWNVSVSKNGNTSYTIHYLNAFHFLKLNGFFRVRDPHQTEDFTFVQQDRHIVKTKSAQDIKSFFIDFLKQKQQSEGKRHFPDELINMLYASEAVSDKKLASLELKDFDFADNTEDAQYLFFDKFIWEIKKDGISQLSKGYPRYVHEENILNNIIAKQYKKSVHSNAFRIEEDYFKIWKDKEGNFDIEILEKNCDFLNYMINTSRVHWLKEKARVPEALQTEYFKTYKFSIAGGLIDPSNPESKNSLSPDEIYEQKMHLINKLFAWGYLLHSYKKGSKAWMVYAMDNEVSEEGKSEGRTGKSLMLHRAMFLFKNSFYIGSRNPKIIDNEFLFGGVTEFSKYILFDDAHKTFQFNRLFTWITGDLNVNVKNKNAFVIPFFLSGKFAYSTNFAPRDLDDSTRDRILFVAFSSWYHGPKEDMPEHKPVHDFGYEFFNGWDGVQWNKFMNVAAQALKFYLGTEEKIGAPESNIRLRNIIAEMGISFQEWAMDYFTEERLNTYLHKNDAYDDLRAKKQQLNKISSTDFKQRVKYYCEMMNYRFNPEEMITDKKHNRIMNNFPNRGTHEAIYLESKKQETKTESLI